MSETSSKGNGLVVVGYVHPGEIDGNFHESIIRLLMADHRRRKPRILVGGGTIAMSSGPRIAAARNEIVQRFLGLPSEPEWLLMADTDMIFAPSALDRLLEAADPVNAPIVGGLCFGGGRSGKIFPTLYRLRKTDGQNSSPIEIIEDYPENGLCRVDATGAAFLLMHRSALLKIGTAFKGEAPWFCEGTVYKGMSFGEDWAFCVRAKSLDVPIYVHTGVKIGHVKPQVLDEDAYRAYRSLSDEIGDGGILTRHTWRLDGKTGEFDVPNFIAIPFKGELEMTRRLAWQLVEDGACTGVILMNNGPELTQKEVNELCSAGPLVEVVECEGMGIYAMWNEGIRHARSMWPEGSYNIGIFNNDLELKTTGFMAGLSKALRADDQLWAVSPRYDDRQARGVQYVRGTFGGGGMAGFCFVVKGELFDPFGPLKNGFDENFSWWYGDDDFTLNVETRGGKIGLVYAIRVEHLDGGSKTSGPTDTPEYQERILADRAYLMEKWNMQIIEKEPEEVPA